MKLFPDPEIDFSDLEQATADLIDYATVTRPAISDYIRTAAELMTEAQLQPYYTALSAVQVRSRTEGAQWVVAVFRKAQQKAEKAERNAALVKAQAETQMARSKRLIELEAENKALRKQNVKLQADLKEAQATLRNRENRVRNMSVQVHTLARDLRDTQTELEIIAPERAPDWDYGPAEQPEPKRGEVVTDAPFQVEVTARQIEEYVKRHPGGRCSKPDVSAALPHCRAYLADAYRHLHSSKRVRVDGWTLEVWQHPA